MTAEGEIKFNPVVFNVINVSSLANVLMLYCLLKAQTQ